jgi:hypothetical protein
MVGETALAKICGQLYPTLVAVAQYTMKSLVVAFGDCDDVGHFAVDLGKWLQIAIVADRTNELITQVAVAAREQKVPAIHRHGITRGWLAPFWCASQPLSSHDRRLGPRIIIFIGEPAQVVGKRCHPCAILRLALSATDRGKVKEGRKGTPGTTQRESVSSHYNSITRNSPYNSILAP